MRWSECFGNGVSMIDHYLDDFIIVRPLESSICGHALDLMCEDLGVLLALDKLEGPADHITFLGIDSATAVLRLPADKLARMRVALQ